MRDTLCLSSDRVLLKFPRKTLPFVVQVDRLRFYWYQFVFVALGKGITMICLVKRVLGAFSVILLGASLARAGVIDNSTVAIIDNFESFPGYDVEFVLDTDEDLRYVSDYASRGGGADTFIDFGFDDAYFFSQITQTDRVTSGAGNMAWRGGNFDFNTAFDYIFSVDEDFTNGDGIADDVVISVERPQPAGDTDQDMIELFQSTTAVPDIQAQFIRWQVTATAGANPGAADFEFVGTLEPFVINGGGETYFQDFDVLETKTNALPSGWSGVTSEGPSRSIDGLGLTDGFLTVPGSDDDGVLGILNLGGNAERFGPATAGHIPTWTAELADSFPNNPLFGRDDAIADNASDRALGISRENNDHAGELNFEVEIAENTLRAFVFDWDLEIWGGDPDGVFRSPEGPGMKVDVSVGGNPYDTMTENLHPGDLFDSLEDGGDTPHNATLIDGNVHSVRGMTSGIKEVSDADGAIGNTVQIKFNSNWNGAADDGANGWFSAIDNVRFRALAAGDADANGVVDVADLLMLLGSQKFNQGVDGVTWEQGDFNADDQFNTGDLLAMLSFLSGTFPSDPYASEAGGASDPVADIIVNSETGEVTVDLAGHTVSAVIIESASEIFNGVQPEWDTTSQFPSTLPGELGNVLFTSTAAGVDELGAVISAEFLGRDKEFYLQDLDLNILIASEGAALTKGNVIVVPEPSTWLMLGLGSLLLVGWRARSNATQSRQEANYGVIIHSPDKLPAAPERAISIALVGFVTR